MTMVCLLLLYLLSFVRKKFNKSRPAGTRLTKLTVWSSRVKTLEVCAYHSSASTLNGQVSGPASPAQVLKGLFRGDRQDRYYWRGREGLRLIVMVIHINIILVVFIVVMIDLIIVTV